MKLKSIVTILISIGLSSLYSILLSSQFHLQSPFWWQSILFFVILFAVLNFVYFTKTDGKTYASILLATIVIKLLLILIFVTIYSFTLKGGFYTFFLHFIGHYILFTVFEIRYLLQLIKTHSK